MVSPFGPFYEGSSIHKRYPHDGKNAAHRAGKSECPPDIDYGVSKEILVAGIRRSLDQGLRSFGETGWPQYVWGLDLFPTRAGARRPIVWEARLTNSGNGTYKAYPCSRDRHADQMPFEVQEALWPCE